MGKICGIYMIKNKINNKFYIGQSIDIEERWKQHIREFKGNYHNNIYLQNAWNKYGQDNFEFSILEECCETSLDEKEIYWIDYYKAYEKQKGYNLTFGGQLNNKCYTEDIKEKMSEIRLNNDKFRGDNLKQSVLSDEEVFDIKHLLLKGIKPIEISKKYNVSEQVIHHIKKCNTWKHICPELNKDLVKLVTDGKGENNPCSILDNDTALKIKIDLANKLSSEYVSKKYNLNIQTVNNIKYLRNYIDIGEEWNDRLKKITKDKNKNLSREEVLEIRNLIKQGYQNKEICEKLNIGLHIVKGIKYGRTYKNIK